METQCKSCGSVKFEYKEGKKICAYCGREVYDNILRNDPIKFHPFLYTLVNPFKTLKLEYKF